MINNNFDVVIDGAGPVGLLAAINLHKAGIKTAIFEKQKVRSNLSRALAIHAGTLELLEETHPDLLQKFLSEGKKLQQGHLGEKYIVDLSLIESKYNFILAIEQNDSEKILEEYFESLGGKVWRGYEFFDAEISSKKVLSKFYYDDNKIFEVNSSYLLDCSGAHSVIRKNVLQLSFEGEKYLGKVVMADIKVNSPKIENFVSLTNNERGIVGIIPFGNESFCRVILIPHHKTEIPQTISLEFFKEITNQIAPNIILSDDSKWLTSFEIHKRMVNKMRVGRVFLLGDAAHIHSPVGGQGMNLGMQDAFNLCAKLQCVLQKSVDENLLDNYEKERMPIIKQVLRNTDRAMKSGIEQSFLSRVSMQIAAKIFAPIFFHSKFLQRRILNLASQIHSARKEINTMRALASQKR